MIKEEDIRQLFPKLILQKTEISEFQKQLRLKGKRRYKKLYDAIQSDAEGEITYKQLSHYYRYDIKLRRALYKIISFTEIAMRAAIVNYYDIEDLTKENVEEKLRNEINEEIVFDTNIKRKLACILQNRHLSLFELLEEADMQILNTIFLGCKEECKKEVFKSNEQLKENLTALRKLRNAAMHNNLLIIKDYGSVYIDGEKRDDLQSHVKNAVLLSPESAKDNLKKLINNCLIIDETKPLSDENQYRLSIKYKVFFAEEKK